MNEEKPIVFTHHALDRLRQRGTNEDDVKQAVRKGSREPAQRGLIMFRLNLPFNREWDGRYYRIQQVAPIVDEEETRIVVVTVYTFYFQDENTHENDL